MLCGIPKAHNPSNPNTAGQGRVRLPQFHGFGFCWRSGNTEFNIGSRIHGITVGSYLISKQQLMVVVFFTEAIFIAPAFEAKDVTKLLQIL